jgi:transposase-like protein
MERVSDRVISLPSESGSVEERMLKGDLVREMVARKQRGAGIKRIARELGVDHKTVRRWLRVGGWQPRRSGPRRRQGRPAPASRPQCAQAPDISLWFTREAVVRRQVATSRSRRYRPAKDQPKSVQKADQWNAAAIRVSSRRGRNPVR